MKYSSILMTATIMLLSCGGDDGSNEPSQVDQKAAYNKQAVVGKWVSRLYAPKYKSFREVAVHDTIALNADGTYRQTREQSSIQMKGNYKVDDVYLSLEVQTYYLSFSKDTMVLGDIGFGDDNCTYKYVRLP